MGAPTDTKCNLGRPSVYSRGKETTIPTASACSANDASVVQPRRERLVQCESSRLSANMVSSKKSLLSLRTPLHHDPESSYIKEKRPHERAAPGNICDT